MLMLVNTFCYQTLPHLLIQDNTWCALNLCFHFSPGFWGGLVPDNALNSSALESLLDAGVLGLKVDINLSCVL